jgi:hypothetical protein
MGKYSTKEKSLIMRTVEVEMDITYDSGEKKVTSLRPYKRNLSLPAQCVVCNEPSTKEVSLLLEIEGLGAAFDYQQTMPYCQKHQIQILILRLLNIMPAIITIGLAVYLFILLGGFGGDGTRFISSGIFLAFFLGAILYFLFKPVIRSFRNGTSGTGLKIVREHSSKELKIEENAIIFSFRFTNDQFATTFARLNALDSRIADNVTSMPTN